MSSADFLTVAALARAKALEPAFLHQLGLVDLPNQQGVGIPYYDDAGNELAVKRRCALRAKDGSYWPRGVPLSAYGQWKVFEGLRRGLLILVEGESDCWTLWHHDWPALGLPGSHTTHTLTADLLAQQAKVYVHVEPDQGGEQFQQGVLRQLAKQAYPGEVFVFRMAAGIKDLSELHLDDAAHFASRLRQALTAARPMSLALYRVAAARAPAAANAAGPTDQPQTVNLAQVRTETVSWLWQGRIPLGKLTILDGDPGLGKSSLTLDLAARLSRGLPMPMQPAQTALPAAPVILMTAEDGLSDTIRPRLEAAGADLNHIIALAAMRTSSGQSRPLSLSRDVQALQETVTQTGAKLVLIDPLMAYLDESVNPHNDQSVRRALLPLAQLAESSGCAILTVRHLNKQAGKTALYRGGGSIGIIGAVRSGLMVCKNPDATHQRFLSVTKSNLCKPARTLLFELEDAGPIAKVRWLEESDLDADAIFAAQAVAQESADAPARQEAETFLQTALAQGARRADELLREADSAGISERTLRRAKTLLGVLSEVEVIGGTWCWRLPSAEQVAPE